MRPYIKNQIIWYCSVRQFFYRRQIAYAAIILNHFSQNFYTRDDYLVQRHPTSSKVKIREMRILLNSFSFNSEKVIPGTFHFHLTYPNQVMRSLINHGSRIKLPIERQATCYKSEIQIGAMKVFRRRDKPHERCSEDWKHHGQNHMKSIIQKVGCKPINWKIFSNFVNCSTPEQYHKIKNELFDDDGFMPPCRSIETVVKTTKGKTDWRISLPENFLDLKLFLDKQRHYE